MLEKETQLTDNAKFILANSIRPILNSIYYLTTISPFIVIYILKINRKFHRDEAVWTGIVSVILLIALAIYLWKNYKGYDDNQLTYHHKVRAKSATKTLRALLIVKIIGLLSIGVWVASVTYILVDGINKFTDTGLLFGLTIFWCGIGTLLFMIASWKRMNKIASKSDIENEPDKILPKSILCVSCSSKLALDEKERKMKSITCPECNYVIEKKDLVITTDINNVKNEVYDWCKKYFSDNYIERPLKNGQKKKSILELAEKELDNLDVAEVRKYVKVYFATDFLDLSALRKTYLVKPPIALFIFTLILSILPLLAGILFYLSIILVIILISKYSRIKKDMFLNKTKIVDTYWYSK